MENLLEKYLYMGMSFSSFKFIEIDQLCIKYELAHLKYFKNKYLKQIYDLLQNNKFTNTIQLEFVNYYIHKEIDAIKNATLFVNPSNEEKKLLIKLFDIELEICEEFDSSLLPENLVEKKATFIFTTTKEMNQHMYLIEMFEKTTIIVLDSLMEDEDGHPLKEDLMDVIKLEILKDDSDFFFVKSSSLYTNQIVNFIFNLNKIGVCL